MVVVEVVLVVVVVAVVADISGISLVAAAQIKDGQRVLVACVRVQPRKHAKPRVPANIPSHGDLGYCGFRLRPSEDWPSANIAKPAVRVQGRKQ